MDRVRDRVGPRGGSFFLAKVLCQMELCFLLCGVAFGLVGLYISIPHGFCWGRRGETVRGRGGGEGGLWLPCWDS